MARSDGQSPCVASGASSDVRLPVSTPGSGGIRRSRMGPRRAAVLIAIQLLMIAHVVHWLIVGKTLSPVEPSEAMYLFNDGKLNAGAIFFGLVLLSTVIVGRYFCGWACHLVAVQDFCGWLMKKIGIKPRAFRSRFLYFAPLALALYMFVWPTVRRLWLSRPAPTLSNHIITEGFWDTFPGWTIGIVTMAVCGFAIVYFLGAKGFCTYGCPYGGFFAPLEKLAIGRIVVSDACEHCGHCTAVCTSNVRVHDEVARFGMVVDPGCMKCMDCVSVCPNDALSFGFARPSLIAKPSKPGRPVPYDFALWEEFLMLGLGFAALLSVRGLYHVPLLMSVGLAAVVSYLLVLGIRLLHASNVRMQNLQFKRGGRLTRSGAMFGVSAAAIFALLVHSGFVQFEFRRGTALAAQLHLGDDIWTADPPWREQAGELQREQLRSAIAHLERGRRWSLFTTYGYLESLVALYVADARDNDAITLVESLVEIAPRRNADQFRALGILHTRTGDAEEAERAYRAALSVNPGHQVARGELGTLLANQGRIDEAFALYREGREQLDDPAHWWLQTGLLLMRLGRIEEAERAYRDALSVDPDHQLARSELGSFLAGQGRIDEALALYAEGYQHTDDPAYWRLQTGLLLKQLGRIPEARAEFAEALAIDDTQAETHYQMGLCYLTMGDLPRGIQHFEQAVRLAPDAAAAQFNLGMARFMSGDAAAAIIHVEKARDMDPNDPVICGFLRDAVGAIEAAVMDPEIIQSYRRLLAECSSD